MSSVGNVGHEEDFGRISLRDLLTVMFKRKLLILSIATSVVVLAMVTGITAPRTYEVSATMLVNEARAEMPIAPAAAQPLIINQVNEEDLNSEIEVLKSRQLIEEVLISLGIDESTVPEGGRKVPLVGSIKSLLGSKPLSHFNGLVVHLQKAIAIAPVRRSNAIRITYESADPEWATQVVGKLTERYLERRVERYQSPQAVVFFEQQMRDAQERLEVTERALERYVDESSITIVEEGNGADTLAAQKAVIMNRLAALETGLDNAEVELESRRRRAASLREMLVVEPERLESSSRFNQDPSTEEIHRALTALRLERDRLLQDFKPDSRHVRDIDTPEDRLETVMSDSSVSGTEANPVYVELRGELLREDAAIEGTRARVTSLRQQVVESRADLETLNSKAFDLEGLQRDARAAETDYMLYRKKHEEARISAAMDQEKFINVTIAQPAQLPLKPTPRGLKMRLLMALFVGILGGVGLSFGIEMYLDRSFTTGEDIERQLGIPHIASIPEGEMVG
jgi:uncharacterized protein involved in exopolysaccharide biosynthesis